MMRVASALVVAVLGACTTSPAGNLGGEWDLTETIASQTGVSCTVTGELLLSHQDGSLRFTGIATRQATCTGAPEGFDPGGADNVINATFEGTSVGFDIDVCHYDGEFAGDAMSGTYECELGVDGAVVPFTGTWQAVRNVGT